MDTKLFTTSAADLQKAAELLKDGKRVVFPTETVYGLGANALDTDAVKSIFEAKGRPSDNPLIVHIAELSQLDDLTDEVTEKAKALIDTFWPGPLTIILKRKNNIPDTVTAGLNTVGIRMPENPVARELIYLSGVPVAAPSANISGRPSPTDANYVIEDMMGRVEGIIDGGNCSVGVESTVIDMTGEIPTILRPGGVTAEEIAEVIGEVIGGKEKAEDKETPKSPGMKYTHYAPKAPVRILRGTVAEIENFLNSRPCKCGILTFDEINLNTDAEIISLGSIKNPNECARNLFRSLRDMDKLDVCEIYAPEIGTDGLWAAVKNRLYKAAGGKIINATDREIVFVCTGNTCRSPMAEGIFNNLPNKGYFSTSAGIYAADGNKASDNAIATLSGRKIDIKNHRARAFTPEILHAAHLVLTMTNNHKDAIITAFPEFSHKVNTLSEAASENKDVSDPYGGDIDVYRLCADEITKYIKEIYNNL